MGYTNLNRVNRYRERSYGESKNTLKGQLVIPAELRKKYQIRPGTEMQLMEYQGILFLILPVEEPVSAACGSLPSKPSPARQLLKERRGELRNRLQHA